LSGLRDRCREAPAPAWSWARRARDGSSRAGRRCSGRTDASDHGSYAELPMRETDGAVLVQQLGDLHGVEGRALEKVVANCEEIE